ncbi:MAG: DsbC family protein [Gammaproteobacteria bacterium]
MALVKRFSAALLLALFLPLATSAEDDKAAYIASQLPEVNAQDVSASPLPGIYEVRYGQNILYVTEDARYMVQGDIFDLKTEKNLTEARRTVARVKAIDDMGESSMIVFEPEGEAARTITVFTDIDCGYCRKLHREIADYNEQGFRVRYLFFPRSGPNTESWSKADGVWCADDRNAALTQAKRGEVIQAADCGVTPTDQHYELGKSFGIRGTPAIITGDGTLIPGYVPADELIDRIDGQS